MIQSGDENNFQRVPSNRLLLHQLMWIFPYAVNWHKNTHTLLNGCVAMHALFFAVACFKLNPGLKYGQTNCAAACIFCAVSNLSVAWCGHVRQQPFVWAHQIALILPHRGACVHVRCERAYYDAFGAPCAGGEWEIVCNNLKDTVFSMCWFFLLGVVVRLGRVNSFCKFEWGFNMVYTSV